MPRLSPRLAAGLAAVLTLAVAAGPAPLRAEGFFQQINDKRLQQSDYDAIAVASRTLLSAEHVEPGAIEPWTNAETGAKGVAELVAASTDDQGRECRTVKQIFQTRAMRSPAAYEARHCRQEDGSWKLAD